MPVLGTVWGFFKLWFAAVIWWCRNCFIAALRKLIPFILKLIVHLCIYFIVVVFLLQQSTLLIKWMYFKWEGHLGMTEGEAQVCITLTAGPFHSQCYREQCILVWCLSLLHWLCEKWTRSVSFSLFPLQENEFTNTYSIKLTVQFSSSLRVEKG